MPLLKPISTGIIPDVPVVPPKPTPAPPAPPAEYFTWTPDGGSTRILSNLSRSGIALGSDSEGAAVIGLDMPPQEEFDTPLAIGGELANGRRWAARPFSLPIVIHADSLDELQTYRRALMAEFDPSREGWFTVSYPGGGTRSLRARYSAGLDSAGRGRAGYPYFDTFDMTLKARDPFAYGDERTVNFAVGPGEDFSPLPFTISPSITTGESTVEIDGEVEVWPVWELRGPMTTATLANRDTGQSLALTPNLSSGQTLTVRMDPRTPPAEQFLRGSTNVWGSVAGDFPVFWSLRPGSNQVTVLASGTTQSSRVTLRYRPRYLTA